MFCYTQTEGIYRKFDCNPDIKELARFVADFRVGNKLARANPNDALADIIAFNCQRLGNDSRWCFDDEGTNIARPSISTAGGGCGSCGAKI